MAEREWLVGLGDEAIQVAVGQIRGYLYPSPAEQAAAYELLIELSDLATSGEFVSSDGSVRSALARIDEVSGATRSILRTHGADASKGTGGNLSLAVIALRMSNEVFKPLLATWQPLLGDHEAQKPFDDPSLSAIEWERRWTHGSRCRSDLHRLRATVRAYIDTLSRIAGAPSVGDALLSVPNSQIIRPEINGIDPEAHANINAPAARLKPRQQMVRWLDPVEMFNTWRAGHRVKESERRTADGVADQPTHSFEVGPDEDFWFDYIADMGDGFDGTAPVAWLAGRRRISIPSDRSGEMPTPPAHLPRGRLMVFGGDQVYPYASAGRYEIQTELPFELGVEGVGGDPATLVAIPGNHDWLGGIEYFEQIFMSKRRFAGRWDTVQSRPYWHVKLPQGWWLWGVDTGLHNILPQEQVEYFTAAAQALKDGDRVVLCTPVPLWQLRQKYPEQYVALRSKLDPLIIERGASLPLCLSGDSHFFAHYESAEPDLAEDHITAGGGGAFLQPTHNLAEQIPLEKGHVEFKITSRWPLPADSRALAPGATQLAERQYWPLIALMAGLHAGFGALLSIDKWHRPDDPAQGVGPGWKDSLLWTVGSPWAISLLVLIALAGVVSLLGNSLEPKLSSAARAYGLMVGIGVSATIVAVAGARRFLDQSSWIAFVVSVVVGGVLSLAVFLTLIRWANTQVKAGDTVAFSPGHSTRFKHFLRFRIDRDGDLTCYAVGIDPAGQGWHDAMTVAGRAVPPHDQAGIPRIHYVWGKVFRKFVPDAIEIAVSISEPAKDEIFLQVCSDLIRSGHKVMFGGRPDLGYTKRLRDIEAERHADNPNVEHHLINYVAAYFGAGDGSTNELMKSIYVARNAAPGESEVERLIGDLSAMRHRMTADAKVRIIIGGDLTPGDPQTRLAPGVLEEAYLAVQAGLPLLVAGGSGGAAKLIADALLGRLDPALLDTTASHFISPESTGDSDGADFVAMVRRFNSLGVLRNGLTDGENRELLTTSDPDTVAGLVSRSLRRISSGHAA